MRKLKPNELGVSVDSQSRDNEGPATIKVVYLEASVSPFFRDATNDTTTTSRKSDEIMFAFYESW